MLHMHNACLNTQEFSLFSETSRLALSPAQSPNQWQPEPVSGREVGHYLHLTPMLRISGAILLLPYMPL